MKTFVFFLAPILIVVGLLGNLISFLVFSRKKLKQYPLNYCFKLMTITDTICLINLLHYTIQVSFENDINLFTDNFCQLSSYFSYVVCPIKGWILFGMSLERFYSIQYPSFKFVLKQKKFQYMCSIFVIMFNLVIYIPVWFFVGRAKNNECALVNHKVLLTVLNFFNETLVPYLGIACMTALIGIAIFNIKSRVSNANSIVDARTARTNLKNIRFSIFSISMNLLYLFIYLLSFPLVISRLTNLFMAKKIQKHDAFFTISMCFYYLNYSLPIFVYVGFHAAFREEIFTIFSFK